MSAEHQPTLRHVTLSLAQSEPRPARASPPDIDAEVHRALDLAWHGVIEPATLNSTTFQAGDTVGKRYLVESFLARGGMGEIYAALDEWLGVRVALKTLLPVVADDPLCIRRLRRELRLARRIRHPNVCRAYNVGVHDNDPRDVVHFLTMELLCGESLAARVRRKALSLHESVEIAEQLLLGLEAVHQAGVLHRDVKSHNVVLERRGEAVRAVLADFGLARRLDTRQRAPGGPSSGSLGYMAPEQISGGELCPATDVFAVGVILFEMCTGRLPFERPGQQLFNGGLDVLSSAAAFRALPAGLRDVLARCLSHSSNDRYHSARAALTALSQLGHTSDTKRTMQSTR